jgi:(1->4)-alpha-D-glucan 1-alpha-D-glucosylmutase
LTPAPLVATYRIQLRPGFGFAETAEVVPYLARLGISHLYLSPAFDAVPASAHGYDVVDPARLRDELGGVLGFELLVAAAQADGLGIVLDIVPHHMAAHAANRWWWDVLELGQSSRYARHFDIDWDPPERRLRGSVLLPVLGDHFGRVLEAGDLKIEQAAGGRFQARYFEHVAPLSPATAGDLLATAAGRAGHAELAFAGRVLQRTEHEDDITVAYEMVQRCLDAEPDLLAVLDDVVEECNADADRLGELLDRQHHRFARWQLAAHELDYRRFFDVDSLVALRSERPEVFDDTHRLVLELATRGDVDGLRIDHIDGLRDPLGYLNRLREAAPDKWILVEKILQPGEQLDERWPVDGTTGYELLADASAVLVDRAGADRLVEVWSDFTGEALRFGEVLVASRREILEGILATDLERVVAVLVRVCEGQRRWRDFSRVELREAIAEVAVHVPAYRTYVVVGEEPVAADIALVTAAVAAAQASRPDIDIGLLNLLRELLLGSVQTPDAAELVARFQQLTGPLAAKGGEDTAFYRWTPLLAANEVGAEPDRPALDPEAFHDRSIETQRRWPRTMVTTSTHDTKRGEDVRARIAVLSEIPEQWTEAVARWSAMNGVPDRVTEWFLYQTLVGAHPLPLERAWPVLEKSMREAKTRTSWVRPDEEFEAEMRKVLERMLVDPVFVADLDAFVAPLVEPGRINALSQVALRLFSPGVPDTYQGCELWDDSLVDPDNRRPVDYDARRAALAEVEAGPDAGALWVDRQDSGLPKLALVRAGLELRRRRPEAFGRDGAYEPAPSSSARVLAFARGASVLVAVPRLPFGGIDDAATVALPPGRWRSALVDAELKGDQPVPFAALRGAFPLAVLERTPTP